MRRIRFVLLALSLAAASAAHAQAPAGETATEAAAQTSAGAPVTTAPTEAAAPASSALPRYTPPRTLRAYTHVFVAFTVAWVLLFGYVIFLSRKFRRVEQQVDALARS